MKLLPRHNQQQSLYVLIFLVLHMLLDVVGQVPSHGNKYIYFRIVHMHIGFALMLNMLQLHAEDFGVCFESDSV